MQRLDGFAWGDAAGMRAAGIDTAAVLRAGLIAFLEGALLYGVFHGDLHGGNLLVQPDGTVALLDFGITGRLGQASGWPSCGCKWAATTNNVTAQVEALRDLGALPADVDVDAVIADLGLDRPPLDPTSMTADEMAAQLRDVTRALLGYGAKLPKELMLFVKNLLFLNGSMAIMAPDVDILGEVLAIVTYFSETHGERIAREMGVRLSDIPVDLDGYRAAIGYSDATDRITFRELQERRDLIRRRMHARHAGLQPGPFGDRLAAPSSARSPPRLIRSSRPSPSRFRGTRAPVRGCPPSRLRGVPPGVPFSRRRSPAGGPPRSRLPPRGPGLRAAAAPAWNRRSRRRPLRKPSSPGPASTPRCRCTPACRSPL